MMIGECEPPKRRITAERKKLTVYYLDYEEKVWYCVVLKEVI